MTARTDTRSSRTLAGTWQLDPQHTRIEFRTRAFWGLATVTGHFDRYDGGLDLSADPAIDLTIDAASINTGNRRRDRHLRSAAFFDAERNPRVRFVSHSVVAEGDTLKVDGRLFARGRSIPLGLDARVRQSKGGLEIAAETTVSHRELGMTWNPLGVIAPRSELRVAAHLIRRQAFNSIQSARATASTSPSGP